MSVVKWSSPGEQTAGVCGVLIKQLPSKHLLITDLSNSLEELRYVVGPHCPNCAVHFENKFRVDQNFPYLGGGSYL